MTRHTTPILAVIALMLGAASASAATPQPTGFPNENWTLVFDEEFSGNALNTAQWDYHQGTANNVTTSSKNVAVNGGNLVLTLASKTSGAEIESAAYNFAVGDYAEASVEFPGSGTTIYNWPAWWTSGQNWPTSGENDIAEGLGTLTVNYHSPLGGFSLGTIPGVWSNAFHIYGIYRGATACDVFYDGNYVGEYPTSDNGQAQRLFLTLGSGYGPTVTGARSQVKVAYVRVWTP
jgi:hypothetical protein